MKEFDSFLEKIVQEKEEEKRKLLEKAKKRKDEILQTLKEEAHSHFEEWFSREKEILLRKKEEEIFKAKLEMKKRILEEKQKITYEALEKVKGFIEKNSHKLPEKKIITPSGERKEQLSCEEFLKFLKEKFTDQIDKFFLYEPKYD